MDVSAVQARPPQSGKKQNANYLLRRVKAKVGLLISSDYL
jgi:hypothetical protein